MLFLGYIRNLFLDVRTQNRTFRLRLVRFASYRAQTFTLFLDNIFRSRFGF